MKRLAGLTALIIFIMTPVIAGPFERAVEFVLSHEKPAYHIDKGGPCKYGICKKWHPKLSLRALTREKAIDIYHDDYWTPAGCDFLDSNMALVVLDGAAMNGVPVVASQRHDVYDAEILLNIRRAAMEKWLMDTTHRDDIIYLQGWEQRFRDLETEIGPKCR